MKYILTLIIVVLFNYCGYNQTNLLNNPESVVYDSVNFRYLVSNNGNGKIIQIDSIGNQSYYPMGITANSLAGMYIKDSLLFAASIGGANSGVLVFNLSTGDSVAIIKPTGLNFLNDIATDNQGFLYVTEYNNNKIFKIDLSNFSSWTYISSGLNMPNGILFDENNNRLLVMCEGSKKEVAISLLDSTLTDVLNTNLTGTDGIIKDNSHHFYISDWTTNAVYQYDNSFQNRVKISGFNDPADIYYDAFHNLIAVPCFNANTVQFIEVATIGIKEIFADSGDNLRPYNHPNPFSDLTTIEFSISKKANTCIYIYDLKGILVRSLILGDLNTGKQQIRWNATNDQGEKLPSGGYVYTIVPKGLPMQSGVCQIIK